MTDAIDPRILDKLVLHDLAVAYRRASTGSTRICHCDATVDAGVLKGSAVDFCKAICDYNAGLEHTYDMIANERYDLRSDHALSECYTVCFSTWS